MDNELKLENLTSAEVFGRDAQIMQAIEEMAELTQALSKANRYWFHAKEVNAEKIKEVHNNVIEEIADVEIMMDQLKYLIGVPEEKLEEVKRYKIMRTARRRERNGRNDEEKQ